MRPTNLIGARADARLRKVAIISDHASPLAAPGSIDSGGQNVYVAHLARELGEAGYAVDVFTRRDSAGQPPLVRWRDQVRVIHVPAGPAHYVPKEAMLPYMHDFARYVIRFALQQRQMYDIVHANFFMSGMVAQQLKKIIGTPYVITFHALGQVRRLAQGEADSFPDARLAIEDLLMHDADRIIAECPQDRIDMEDLYATERERIDIVPCGFDPQELWQVPMEKARRALGLPDNKFIALQLGRMVPRKGVDTVIEAAALLRQQYGVDVQLLVVGGNTERPGAPDGAELARLRALAGERGITEHVVFTGQQPRSALRQYYSAANAFVTTPWYEPFGITPVEAMACATPVVGSAVGGIKSTVVDGETGFLVPPRDPAAVAERLVTLHDNPALARRQGAQGMRRSFQHFTWRRVAEQLAAIYESVLRQRPHATARFAAVKRASPEP